MLARALSQPGRSARWAVAGAAALAGLLLLAGCSGSTGASAQQLAPRDFATAVQQPGTVVLDVRTPAEYAAGHLPGAVNIDVQAADFASRIQALDKKAAYAVYCHSGRRSAAAAAQMSDAGFSQVVDLDGGIQAWQQSGAGALTAPSAP